jgi:hypothetical protein
VDETAPTSGGIKLSGLVLVKSCRAKNKNYSLAGDQPPKNHPGGRRSGRITKGGGVVGEVRKRLVKKCGAMRGRNVR